MGPLDRKLFDVTPITLDIEFILLSYFSTVYRVSTELGNCRASLVLICVRYNGDVNFNSSTKLFDTHVRNNTKSE